jgi:purine-binding chemotaxis protein CheW
MEAASADRGSQFLSVRIGGGEFAMDIMAIREIRGWIASTPLPHAPSYVRGMINLRGAALAIIDFAERLGLQGQPPSAASVVVVVESEGQVVGLLVDAVCDIITVRDQMRQALPETGGIACRRYIESLVMMEERIISILSLRAIIPAAGDLEIETQAA